MKKFLLLVFLCLGTLNMKAQVYGAFDCKDPKAWFDKEIYFVAQNNVVSYGYGQNLANVSFVVDGKYLYTMNGYWQYGSYIRIDDVKMDKGTVVNMYLGNQQVASWTCNQSNPSILQTALSAYRDYRIAKRVFKLIKKIK